MAVVAGLSNGSGFMADAFPLSPLAGRGLGRGVRFSEPGDSVVVQNNVPPLPSSLLHRNHAEDFHAKTQRRKDEEGEDVFSLAWAGRLLVSSVPCRINLYHLGLFASSRLCVKPQMHGYRPRSVWAQMSESMP